MTDAEELERAIKTAHEYVDMRITASLESMDEKELNQGYDWVTTLIDSAITPPTKPINGGEK